MLIKRRKNQSGFVLVGVLILAISMITCMMAYMWFRYTVSPNIQTIQNSLLFTNHLVYSKSNQNEVTLTYMDIAKYEQDAINSSPYLKSQCNLGFCKLLSLKDYPANTYVKLFYKENDLTSFIIVSEKYATIFDKYGTVPFWGWNQLMDRQTNGILDPTEVLLFKDVHVYTANKNNIDIAINPLQCIINSCVNIYQYNVPSDFVFKDKMIDSQQ